MNLVEGFSYAELPDLLYTFKIIVWFLKARNKMIVLSEWKDIFLIEFFLFVSSLLNDTYCCISLSIHLAYKLAVFTMHTNFTFIEFFFFRFQVILYEGVEGGKQGEFVDPSCKGNAHDGGVFGLCWSPDDSNIATASGDKTVKVWNVATKELQKFVFSFFLVAFLLFLFLL